MGFVVKYKKRRPVILAARVELSGYTEFTFATIATFTTEKVSPSRMANGNQPQVIAGHALNLMTLLFFCKLRLYEPDAIFHFYNITASHAATRLPTTEERKLTISLSIQPHPRKG